MKSRQTNLFEYFEKTELKKRYGRTEYGGVKAKGFRKLERPLSTKKWIHLVLKSEKAVGDYSLLNFKNKSYIEKTLREKAKKFGVLIDSMVNVGNHIHLKIKIVGRIEFQKFLKSVTCLIARKVTGAKKGKPFGRFWQHLAYTRVLKTALEELNLRGYFEANRRQAKYSYKARQEFLKKFNAWVYRERKSSAHSSA